MDNLMENCIKAIKTGELKRELAKSEIKNNKLWTDSQIKKAIKETNTNIITRDEINLEKELLTNIEYQKLQEKISAMCDSLKYIAEEKRKEYKENLLNVVNQRDSLYDDIKSRYNISF